MKNSLIHSFTVVISVIIVGFFVNIPVLDLIGLMLLSLPITLLSGLGFPMYTQTAGPLGNSPSDSAYILSAVLLILLVVLIELLNYFNNRKGTSVRMVQ